MLRSELPIRAGKEAAPEALLTALGLHILLTSVNNPHGLGSVMWANIWPVRKWNIRITECISASSAASSNCQSGVWQNQLPASAPTMISQCVAPDYAGCQLSSDGFTHNFYYRIDTINRKFCMYNGNISYGAAGRCRLMNTSANTWTLYTGSLAGESDGQICYVSCW